MNQNEMNTFVDIFYLWNEYRELIAFETKTKKYTYAELQEQILFSSYFFSHINQKKIGIKITNTYKFVVILFSVLLTNNIAVLLGNNTFEDLDLLIDDHNVDNYLTTEKKGIIKSRDNIECAVILFSSGTHGQPKGVMLSERNLITNTFSGMRMYRYNHGYKYLNFLPNYHAFGLVCDLFGPLFSGGTICIMESRLDFLNSLIFFNPDCLNIAPAFLPILCQCLKQFKFNLKKVISGGAHTNYDDILELHKIGVGVYSCYGLSECSPCVSISPENDFLNKSCGKILDCCNIIIIDNEICIEGSNVMIGYYGHAKHSGLYHTGDLGYLKNGYLYVTGRVDELIVLSSGIKLSPLYIESKLNEKKEVIESLLKKENDKVTLYIFAKEKVDLTDIEEISYVDMIQFVDMPLPRNETGKLIR